MKRSLWLAAFVAAAALPFAVSCKTSRSPSGPDVQNMTMSGEKECCGSGENGSKACDKDAGACTKEKTCPMSGQSCTDKKPEG